jgi:hypothetical protein
MNPGFYPATLNSGLKTGARVFAGMALSFAVLGFSSPDPHWMLRWLLLAAAVMLIHFKCWVMSVRGYTVESRELIIHRLFGETRIPLEGLQSAEPDPEAIRGAVRLFANGGLFGYTGWFWSRKLGRFRAWATNRANTVVLHLSSRTIVISPDQPADFVQQIKSHTVSLMGR